jgi:hypothetical protein
VGATSSLIHNLDTTSVEWYVCSKGTAVEDDFAHSAQVSTRDSYVGVLIILWLLLFPAQPKEFFLDGL